MVFLSRNKTAEFLMEYVDRKMNPVETQLATALTAAILQS